MSVTRSTAIRAPPELLGQGEGRKQMAAGAAGGEHDRLLVASSTRHGHASFDHSGGRLGSECGLFDVRGVRRRRRVSASSMPSRQTDARASTSRRRR